MPRPQAPVAVVLVNWNGARDTLATLASLDRTHGAELRPIVVDNGSTDGSVEQLRRQRPGLEVLATGENLGFAGGNLVGVRRALADPEVGWVLFLNTDVELDPGFLPPLIAACADPGVAAAGPKIFFASERSRLWAAGGRLRLRETVTQEWGRNRPDGPRWSVARDVTYLTTCCLLVPRKALLHVGPLDPLYFLNVDDADWCRRAVDLGYRLRYVPESRIWHKVAVSTRGSYTPMKTYHTGRSNTLFVRRHHGPAGLALYLLWNALGLALAYARESWRDGPEAVWAKARGIRDGMAARLPPPPRL